MDRLYNQHFIRQLSSVLLFVLCGFVQNVCLIITVLCIASGQTQRRCVRKIKKTKQPILYILLK